MENLSQWLLEIAKTKCILGIVGLVIGVYPGFCGPKTIVSVASIETGLFISLTLAKQNELANALIPIILGTLASGFYFYLKSESMKNKD